MTRTSLLSLWFGIALLGGACGGGGSSMPPDMPDTSLHTVEADDANLQCGTHPNVAGQMTTATELATAVKTALAW